jgi:hypothetical protein
MDMKGVDSRGGLERLEEMSSRSFVSGRMLPSCDVRLGGLYFISY